jgi:dihydrofolate reductase
MKKKVKLFIASSLDGYIARADHSIDWLFMDGDYGYAAFYESIDVIVMGRKTYALVEKMGSYPYGGKKTFVLSKSRDGEEDENVVFTKDPIRKLIAQAEKGVWLVGGGEIIREFLQEDLIDEFIVSVHPILLGRGISLFPPNDREIGLELASSTVFKNGLVQLCYVRASGGKRPRRKGRPARERASRTRSKARRGRSS